MFFIPGTMKRLSQTTIFLYLMMFEPTSASGNEILSVLEAKAALKSFQLSISKTNNKTASLLEIEIRSIEGCYPIKGRLPSDKLCLVDIKGLDGSFFIQEFPFRFEASKWELLDPKGTYYPACPSRPQAQTLLREVLPYRNVQLAEEDVPSDGVFTNERGANGNKKGPMRLACTYGVSTDTGKLTVIGYFRYEHGQYAIDPDKEIWPG
jgi:hypothetical protein